MQRLTKEIEVVIQNELSRANEKFPLFHSTHEGIAIIYEELNEAENEMESVKEGIKALWEEIKLNESADILTFTAKKIEDKAKLMACESIQTSAMCQKFIDSFDNKEAYINE